VRRRAVAIAAPTPGAMERRPHDDQHSLHGEQRFALRAESVGWQWAVSDPCGIRW
jgi:hypothetical protein